MRARPPMRRIPMLEWKARPLLGDGGRPSQVMAHPARADARASRRAHCAGPRMFASSQPLRCNTRAWKERLPFEGTG
eukprot:scaffold194175_cov31-Tisochrysis_lutea.AAC.2